MNHQEKSELVRRICSRKLYGTVSYRDVFYYVCFSDPSLDLMTESDWVYKNRYNELKKEGQLFTIEESYEILRKDKKWTDKLEEEMELLKKDISILHKSLAKIKFNKTATRATVKIIDQRKKRLEELFYIKNQYRGNSIEAMAELSRKRFLIGNISLVKNGEKIIKDLNPDFKDVLAVYYFEESGISESKIRELARSDPWRLYWATSKDTGTPLFPHSCVEITDLQYYLTIWSRIYDFAYGSSNRPTDEVINDDDQFDAWYKEESDRIDAETSKAQVGDRFGSASEVFIPSDQEGAKEVYALNDTMARQRIRNREKFILEKGEVRDQALPDVKENIQIQLNKMSVDTVKNRR